SVIALFGPDAPRPISIPSSRALIRSSSFRRPGGVRGGWRLNYTRVIAAADGQEYPGERMFDDLVLGMDPGTAAVGLAVVGRRGPQVVVVWAETVHTPAGLPAASRLLPLYRSVRDAIMAHRPGAVAIERLMW